MKKLRLLAGILSLLMISACTPLFRPSDTDTPNPPVSDSSVNPPTPADSQTVTDPADSETIPPEVPTVSAPPEGTPGVFFADSFAALREGIASEDFLTYPDRPTLCITEAFAFEEPLTVSRDADILYLPAECAGGTPITVRCGEAVPALTVITAAPMLLEGGLLLIDAPAAALTVIGDTLPAPSAVALYCNVASYNGNAMEGNWGGTGADRLAGVTLTNTATGKPYDGVSLSVIGNLAVVHVPLIVSETDVRSAKIAFTTEGGQTLPPQKMDLTAAGTITITDADGKRRTYLLTSERLSYNLPLMEIHTDGGVPIVEKNTYIHGTLTIDGEKYPMKIRGRGNASWNQFPKKAYRIKLDEGAPLFGLPKNRDWVLASNYADKTMIRNCVAHTIAASLAGLSYTPTHFPVNLYLNGTYLGVYTFADKIEEGKGRLDLGDPIEGNGGVTDVGFLLEFGWDYDQENVYNRDYFDTDYAFRLFVKEPEIQVKNSKEFLIVKNYILAMENAIVRDDGWEDYIDVDSFVDWFIINELTFNTESSFYRSCYLWREAGGKLKMGPVWDFDMAFGNHYGDLAGYNGWCTTESTYQYISENWMNHLMQYDTFTDRLVARWNEVREDLRTTALSAVDDYAAMLDGSQQQNFLVWDIMGKRIGMGSVSPSRYDTYEKQVQYLRDFIETRWNYMDARLNSDEYK